MAPTSWTALLLLCLAVLPGAMFTFGFERQVSAYGVTLADRVLRFIGVSLVFDALYAWPAYGAYRLWIAGRPFGGGQFAAAWLAVVTAAALPATLGGILGGLYGTRTSRSGWSWLRRWLLPPGREERLLEATLGPKPAPRAWDDFFSQRPNVYLRVRTTAGDWLGGRYGPASYAAEFPHEPDLLLEEAWPMEANGAFGAAPRGCPLYIPATTIAYIEIFAHRPEKEADPHG